MDQKSIKRNENDLTNKCHQQGNVLEEKSRKITFESIHRLYRLLDLDEKIYEKVENSFISSFCNWLIA